MSAGDALTFGVILLACGVLLGAYIGFQVGRHEAEEKRKAGMYKRRGSNGRFCKDPNPF